MLLYFCQLMQSDGQLIYGVLYVSPGGGKTKTCDDSHVRQGVNGYGYLRGNLSGEH